MTLCARSAEVAQRLAAERVNTAYLPGAFPSLVVAHDAGPALASADLHIIGTPMAGLRERARRLPAAASVFWLCKALKPALGAWATRLHARWGHSCARGRVVGSELCAGGGAGRPTALVAASRDEGPRSWPSGRCTRAAAHLHQATRSASGGGAVKNVLAIAVGICDGLGQRRDDAPLAPGLNARRR